LEKVREDKDGEWFLMRELADDPAKIERTTQELTVEEADVQLLLVGVSREDADAIMTAARVAFAR
jgi:hypothetical protein